LGIFIEPFPQNDILEVYPYGAVLAVPIMAGWQRLAIARAIVNIPDILFADEPCANLDTENSRMVLDLLRKINREREQTIVMVSHEDCHTAYFDRVVRLKDGRLVNGAAS